MTENPCFGRKVSQMVHSWESVDESHVPPLLPEHNESLPHQVRWFLLLCETAIASERYQRMYLEEPQTKFCKGVVDYWWESNDDLVEPTLEQLWRDPFDNREPHQMWPTQQRIAYQKGAIVGYKLSERFNNE